MTCDILTKEQFKVYQKFAYKIVKEKQRLFIRRSPQIFRDAVEAGLMGIVDGILNYDENRDCKIESFIYKCMSNRILTFIINYNQKNTKDSISIDEKEMDIKEDFYSNEISLDHQNMLVLISETMMQIREQHEDLSPYFHKYKDLLVAIYDENFFGSRELKNIAQEFNMSSQAIDIHKQKLLALFRFKIRQKYGELI